MSKPVKYFAIFGFIIAIVLIAYNIFLKDKDIGTGSLLVRESTTVIGETAAVTELLIVLRSLQGLTIDTSVFEDRAYLSLKDYSVILDVVPQGKTNPFAPL